MKLAIDFEDGKVLTFQTDHLVVVDNGGKETVLAVRTEHTLIPVCFFKSLLATDAEVKARAVVAEKK